MNTFMRTVTITAALFLSLLCSAHAETTFNLPGVQSAYADIDDIRMYYETYGKGEPLLLIPPTTIGSYNYQLPELIKKFQVIAPELRGHWRSTDSAKPFSYRLMAEDTIKLMDYLKIKSAYIVGWSDGGVVGLIMAYDHPERVRKLVVIGSHYHFNGYTDEWLEFSRNFNSDSLPSLKKTFIQVAPDSTRWPVFVKKIKQIWLSEPTFTKDQLKQIQCPTLVMVGDHDIIKISHTVDFFEGLPKGQLMVVPNATHYVPREKPEIVNQAIITFLAEEDKKPGDTSKKKEK